MGQVAPDVATPKPAVVEDYTGQDSKDIPLPDSATPALTDLGIGARPEPDYKALFRQSIGHLRAVYASRNSFTEQVDDLLAHGVTKLRTNEVYLMHEGAGFFLRQHDTEAAKVG